MIQAGWGVHLRYKWVHSTSRRSDTVVLDFASFAASGTNAYMALWGLCLPSFIWEFPKIRGTLFGGPHVKDYCILGSILGSPHFGKLKDVYIDRGVHVRPGRGSSVGSRLIASGETVCCKPPVIAAL